VFVRRRDQILIDTKNSSKASSASVIGTDLRRELPSLVSFKSAGFDCRQPAEEIDRPHA
jgi:hypothetical protein